MAGYVLPDDLSNDQLKARKTALKSAFTRRELAAQSLLSFLDDKEDTETTLSQIKTARKNLEDSRDKIEYVISRLQISDPANEKSYQTEFEEIDKRFLEVDQPLLNRIITSETPETPTVGAVPAPITSFHKIDNMLAPKFKLSRDHSPIEYRRWQDEFRAWYQQNQMHSLPLSLQHSYFRTHIQQKLYARIHTYILNTTPVFSEDFSEDMCMTLLDEEFKG